MNTRHDAISHGGTLLRFRIPPKELAGMSVRYQYYETPRGTYLRIRLTRGCSMVPMPEKAGIVRDEKGQTAPVIDLFHILFHTKPEEDYEGNLLFLPTSSGPVALLIDREPMSGRPEGFIMEVTDRYLRQFAGMGRAINAALSGR